MSEILESACEERYGPTGACSENSEERVKIPNVISIRERLRSLEVQPREEKTVINMESSLEPI